MAATTEAPLQAGDRCCFMLAFGQFYDAVVAEVYADQTDEAGFPTVDLDYENAQSHAYHVRHDANAQQPNSYSVHGEPGYLIPTSPTPLPAEPAAEGDA